MDLTRLRMGELVLGASAVGLLIVMFMHWFGGRSGFDTMTIGRVLLVAAALCGLTVVGLTVTARAVAIPLSATAITIGVSFLALLEAIYRVAINEPGPNALISVDLGAYLGLALAASLHAGAWLAARDERTTAAASLRQTERVLAVRGTPRPAPPERDPSRPARA